MNRTILHGDALDKLKEIGDNTIDLMATDPPYGYSFMNKDWDKALISVDIWKECLRVLKPGAFAFVMSAPRQDVLSHMIVNLTDAGFVTNFTSIYWAYGTGFPKAANISKLVDKKLGCDREITGKDQCFGSQNSEIYGFNTTGKDKTQFDKKDNSSSLQAKKLDGSYGGFQPKPAVEVILVCMKPLSKKSFTEQAMSNGKGVTWLDDCRIPFKNDDDIYSPTSCDDIRSAKFNSNLGKILPNRKTIADSQGRFPANLLVSDDALNDGKIRISKYSKSKKFNAKSDSHLAFANDRIAEELRANDFVGDSGSFSRYFDLDKWEAQFIITPKPSKSEKNKGLENFMEQQVNDGRNIPPDNAFQRGKTERKNTHPTVKPVSLFKYLVTMGSRENDLILDPFMGSGTTAIACEQVSRDWIGIEKLSEHIEIFNARLANYRKQNKIEAFL